MASMVLLSLRILAWSLNMANTFCRFAGSYPARRIRATSTGGISLKFAPQER